MKNNDYREYALAEIYRRTFLVKKDVDDYKNGLFELPFDSLYREITSAFTVISAFYDIDLITDDEYCNFRKKLSELEELISDEISDYWKFIKKHYHRC